MRHRVRLPLVGAFQVENALVAAGQAIAGGGAPAAVFAALEGLVGAKGRLELVGRKSGAPIFVDYAHKPDALAKALDALRPYVSHRLVVVFGAGGDRDAGVGLEGRRDEIMAVMIIALDGEEGIARRNAAAVDRNAHDGLRQRPDAVGAGRSHDGIERPQRRLHDGVPAGSALESARATAS